MVLQVQGTATSTGSGTIVRSFPLPVPRVAGSRSSCGRVTVVEVLKVFFDSDTIFNLPAEGQTLSWVTDSFLSTRGLPPNGKSDSSIVAYMQTTKNVSSLDPSNSVVHPYVVDVTDGDGHGLLVATDQIVLTLAVGGVAPSSPMTLTCRILYRFKDIGIEEYVGIVQSQQ